MKHITIPNRFFLSALRLTIFGCITALVLALIAAACAETPPAAIPFSDIGIKATADYHGDALAIKPTSDGARLRCGFQKLDGHATAEGLWLESTSPGGEGKLRLIATALGREQSSVRSAMSIATVAQENRAPSGATCAKRAAGLGNMPLLSELENNVLRPPFFRHAAPDGAIPSLIAGAQTLARAGTVSVEDKLVRFTRSGVTEEYSVSVDGVRQDFVIVAPPMGTGNLRLELALSGAHAEVAAHGARLKLDDSGRVLAYSRLQVKDAAGRELSARLEVISANQLAVTVADARASYPVRVDPTFSDADWVSLNPGMPGASDNVYAIAVDDSGNVYVGGGFTCIGTVSANYIAKWDGSVWSGLGSGVMGRVAHASPAVNALAVSGTNLYVGGEFATAGGVLANSIAKWDGRAWSALGSGINGLVNALAVSGTNLYAGGWFTTAGGSPANYIAKWNGSAWSTLASGLGGPSPWVQALAVSGTDLYAGGWFTTAGGVWATNIAKWDGSAWSALGSGMNGTVNALAVSGTNIYAGGRFTMAGGVGANNLARWDGIAWSTWPFGIDSDVYALAVSGNDLYVGGAFTHAGGVPAKYIAKWNGSAWSALGSEIDMPGVSALLVSATGLYAGGYFTMAGGAAANRIAKWDGSTWSALGSGISDSVSALAVSGTDLYAAGRFTMAGSSAANYVAKWNGAAWSALGSGMNGTVSALAVSGTNLYAGGNFTTAGGVQATNIAKWDGSAWSALGSGVLAYGYNNYVYALAVSGTDLYAGGAFTWAGGAQANYIAKWNGSAWSALGSGMNSFVYALAVSGTNLYVGGYFTTAGGMPANRIAKWDGSAWSALSSGVNSTVNALTVSGTDLYAGGYFTNASGVAANRIAKWNGSAWSALGSGVDGVVSGGNVTVLPAVNALAVSGTDLYAGGEFTTAGGAPANFIARWDGSAWSALGSGVNYPGSLGGVSALAADRAGHLFVGGWFILAGTNLSFFIAQANVGSAPTISMSPQTQTAEAGGAVNLAACGAGYPPPSYQWYFNGNAIIGCTTSALSLSGVQAANVGTYSVVISNAYGAVTSAPAILNVIAAVERRPVAAINFTAEVGSFLNVEFAAQLDSPVNWLPLDTVGLTDSPQFYFDITAPLPSQRFYRAWQLAPANVVSSLDLLGVVPALTLTGAIGNSVRVDYINQFGPIDAWVTLDTVALTNATQLYFDTSSIGQPPRLWRIVPLP